MTTKTLRLVGAFFLLLPCLLMAADRPNVLVILADDLGYSDLGCYGGEIATPHLDALAANGLRFTQFYNTARCWPSRAAVTTGYYAQQVRRDSFPGVNVSGSRAKGDRPKWAPLLSERLRPLGYRNYHSGKWHIDSKPLEAGFDRSLQIEGGQNNFFSVNGVTWDGKPMEQTPDFYMSTAMTDHAVDCLMEHAAQHADKPFFHYLCYISPHFPLHARADDIARYQDTYTPGWDAIQQSRSAKQKSMGIVDTPLPPMEREVGPPYDFPEAFKILGPGEINRPLPWAELNETQRAFQAAKMSIHAAMIDRMDKEIGRVIDQLKAMGAYENTLIFFASDNGASAEIMVRGGGHDPNAPMGSEKTYLCLGPGWSSAANTPLRRHKTWVHEGGISTPLVVHWPKGIAAKGELRRNPGHLVDIVPTVMEAIGAPIPAEWNGEAAPPMPGKSLIPAFAKDGTVEHDALWWYHEGNRAIRVGDWKLTAEEGGEWELYEVAKDRGEMNNMAAQFPEKVEALAKAWQSRADEYLAQALKDAPVAPVQENKKKPKPKKAG